MTPDINRKKIILMQDKFGNQVPFVATPKDKDTPADIINGGPTLKKKVGDSELTLQLDILHVQRGECKGMRYWGKRVTKDNLPQVEEFVGSDVIAARFDTSFNTENQRYCLGQGDSTKDTYIKPIEKEDELLNTLANRSVRDGESKSALQKEMQSKAEEMNQALKAGDATKVMALAQEIAALNTKIMAK